MDLKDWIVIAIAGIGVLGQLYVAATRKGADDQKLASHDSSILSLRDDVKDHETRISRVEGRLAP